MNQPNITLGSNCNIGHLKTEFDLAKKFKVDQIPVLFGASWTLNGFKFENLLMGVGCKNKNFQAVFICNFNDIMLNNISILKSNDNQDKSNDILKPNK